MKIIEHGKHGTFIVRGKCPVCECVFETVVTKGENGTYDCVDKVHVVDCNGYPVDFFTSCPECKHQDVAMRVMNHG